YVVPGYFVEGCTLFAGRPKLGKSWLCLEVGLAVASGSTCLGGLECGQGDVLYLALEDNERRLQRRIEKLLGRAQEWPEAFHYATEWPRAAEGSEAIRAWLKRAKSPRLVVVDVLMMYRAAGGRRVCRWVSLRRSSGTPIRG
ncbi:MAG TPA: AAA family ATPase, partial [Aestuariivirgaceae bacterium]|nr:AAA family ATPase [Aestuariivirgaceae bacterium]